MRYCFSFFLFLSFSTQTYSQGKSGMDTLHLGDFTLRLIPVSKTFYDSIPYPSCCDVDADPGVFISTDSLVFHLRNGRTDVMRSELLPDSDDLGPGTIYYYVGSIKELDCWVVGMSGYETSHYILVSKEDGEEDVLEAFCSVPIVSPDKKYVVYGSDYGNIEGINRIYFYRLENGKMTGGGLRINARWGPDEFRWSGGHILYARIAEMGFADRYVRIDWKERKK